MTGVLVPMRSGDLIAGLEAFCEERSMRAGWARAVGRVADVVIAIDGQPIAEFATATLVSFDATLAMLADRPSARATAVVTTDVGGVPLTLGGQLLRARCVDVELGVFPCEGDAARVGASDGSVVLEDQNETDADEATSNTAPAPRPSRAIAPPESVQRTKPVARSESKDWSKVVAASAAAAATDWDDGEVDVDELSRGDVLLHPTLGECRVVDVISDDAVKVRLPNGAVRKLVMKPFRLYPGGPGRYLVEKR